MGMVNATTILFTIFATSIHAITTNVKNGDLRRHIGQSPPSDWELGLREASHQALLREHNTDPSLRDRLLEAPIEGRQDTYLPFGDITVLARGQLYAGPYGYKFVQDRYQNDCDDCHNRRIRCGPFQCDSFKLPGDQHRLIALWTVKRIRHRDPRYGHRYEIEYTISPINEAVDSFVTSTGGFDYGLPGHVFIEKSDARKIITYQLINPPTDDRNNAKVPQWHDSKIQEQTKPNHNTFPQGHYKPGFLIGIDPNGYKHILHSIPDLHKINEEFSPYRPHQEQNHKQTNHEFDLYKGLIESLNSKTSSPIPNLSFTNENEPHRFTLFTKPTEATVVFRFDNTQVPTTQIYPLTKVHSRHRINKPTKHTEYLSFFTPTMPMITSNKGITSAVPRPTLPTTRQFGANPVFLSKRPNRPTSPTYTMQPLPLQTPITKITYFMPVDETLEELPKSPPKSTTLIKKPFRTNADISPTTETPAESFNKYIPLSSNAGTTRATETQYTFPANTKSTFVSKDFSYGKPNKKTTTRSTFTPFISKQEETTKSEGVFLSNTSELLTRPSLLSSPSTPMETTGNTFLSNKNNIDNTLQTSETVFPSNKNTNEIVATTPRLSQSIETTNVALNSRNGVDTTSLTESTNVKDTTLSLFSLSSPPPPSSSTTLFLSTGNSLNKAPSLSPTQFLSTQDGINTTVSTEMTSTNVISISSESDRSSTVSTASTLLNQDTTSNTEADNTTLDEVLITPRSLINVLTSTQATTKDNELKTSTGNVNDDSNKNVKTKKIDVINDDKAALLKINRLQQNSLRKSLNTQLPSTTNAILTTKMSAPTRSTTTKRLSLKSKSDDDLDIFDFEDKNIYSSSKVQMLTTKQIDSYKNEGDFLFGSFEKSNYTDEKPKIIYSNFYRPSSITTPTTLSDILVGTTTDEVKNTITTNKATEETLPRTSLSYQTSISYEVNRKNTTKAPTTTTVQFDPTIKAKIKQLPNYGKFRVYKAELPEINQTQKNNASKPTSKTESNEDFDLLALSLVNHARTIKILNSTTKMPSKYRRKNYSSRIKYTRKRKLQQ